VLLLRLFRWRDRNSMRRPALLNRFVRR
jgi:hypothetical protein